MATELLCVPERHLRDVINVIQAGLDDGPQIDPEVRAHLTKWCADETAYLIESGKVGL